MKLRQLAHYPPYCYLVSILIQGKNENEVAQSARDIKVYLQKQLNHAAILGPAPSMIYKLNDDYRQRLTLKIVETKNLYPVLERMNDFYKKRKVNVICDFHPYTMI